MHSHRKLQPPSVVNIEDLRRLAKRRLPKVIWDYLEGGAEDEVTLRRNRAAFDRYHLLPRMVTGKGSRDLSITLFGQRLAAPFMIGPTGLNGIYVPDADLMLARAAAAAGVGFSLSAGSNNDIEAVARVSDGPKFFQLYPWGGREVATRLLARARAAGYCALMVTVDSLIPGNRERDVRNRFAHALHFSPRIVWDAVTHPHWVVSTWFARGMPRFENLAEFLPPGSDAYALAAYTRAQRNPFYSWEDIAWLRSQWTGPLVIKGILTADDARLAASHGADAVVVSNHGGRSLDGMPATLDVLPSVVAASGGMPVLVDSGFRRGSHIVKALALGARGVLLGRAPLYGVAAAGEAGASRALEILLQETDRVMGLLGVDSVDALGHQHVGLQPA